MTDNSKNKDILAKVSSRVAAEGEAKKEAETPLTFHEIISCERENVLGDAKIYAHLFRGKTLFARLWDSWLRWTGHYWEPDTKAHQALINVEAVAQEYMRAVGEAKDQLKKPDISEDGTKYFESAIERLLGRAHRLRGNSRKHSLEFVMSGADSLSIEGDELDRNPALFGLPNGVMDLEVCDVRPGKPDDWLTVHCPTEWKSIDEPSPIFDAFLMDMLSDNPEMVAFVLRYMGMSLYGRQREHVFLVFFGEKGRNGKDTLMGLLQDVLGGQMCSDIPAEMLMERRNSRESDKPAPDLLNLKGKRIGYASESSRKHRFCSETVKRLTGGGSLSARGLHTNYLTWEMTHSLVLLTNDLPAAPAEDEAFWSRFLGVELKRRYVEKPNPDKPEERPMDRDLRKKMKAESSGILSKLLKGYLDYSTQGLNPPPEVTAFGDEYRRNEDLIGLFLADYCILKEGEEAQAATLYTAFDCWYKENVNSKGGYSAKSFSKDMKKKGFITIKKSKNFYQGVALTPEAEAQIKAAKEKKQKEKRPYDL